jgi:hypothetical protein
MRYWIITQGEEIVLIHHTPKVGTIEVEAPDDFVDCGDTQNKYRYIDGQIVLNPNYV